MSALAPILESFFTERLNRQLHASSHTVRAYRDTFRLLLSYAHQHTGKQPSQLDLAELDAACISRLTGRSYRHRRGRGRTRDGALKQSTNLRSIHERPAHVNNRGQVGHWEGDLIICASQRSAIATLVERKIRLTILVRLPGGHSAQLVGDRLIEAFNRLPAALRRSLTWDQGNDSSPRTHSSCHWPADLLRRPALPLAARHEREHERASTPVFFPKGEDLERFTDEHLAAVAAETGVRSDQCHR